MTYEDVKRIRDNPCFLDVDNKELSSLIDEAIEKQIPKKPSKLRYYSDSKAKAGYCGCNCFVTYAVGIDSIYNVNYCPYCGQKIDWSDEK